MNTPLNVAFIWHMHQPYYKDLLSGNYLLPWVRLHATKDYYDMAAILYKFPTINQTFNVVPSLLMQIDDYAKGEGRDIFLELSKKPAHDLLNSEKEFILLNFFFANWENMIKPFPRYWDLLHKRGLHCNKEEIEGAIHRFSDDDFRDLQLLFNLCWFDPVFLKDDDFIAEIVEKGKNFTEEEKINLLDKQREIVAMVIPNYKKLMEEGRVELTTTPYYHPILPLLCDSSIASTAMPDIRLPEKNFKHPEDADAQLKKAIEFHKKTFGSVPKGMWPSEGSVSEEALSLIASRGIEWVATDEEILEASSHKRVKRSANGGVTNPDFLYKPYLYKAGDKDISIVFRDHQLSDLIGFVYSSWEPESAARDFMDKLTAIRHSLAEKNKKGDHLVSVILDGENCWEHYKNDGWDFLSSLYKMMEDDPLINMVTVSEHLESHPPEKRLDHIFPGSWINHNFKIWIGHEEDNRAWNYLKMTRDALIMAEKDGKVDSDLLELAWEHIYIAEGSDWCWWYGDEHSTENDIDFDRLFRKNLINVYKLIKKEVPSELTKPIIETERHLEPVSQATSYIYPTIDGEITNYFEWLGAGLIELELTGGTMHKASFMLSHIYYGFNRENIFFRIDLNDDVECDEISDLCISLIMKDAHSIEINVEGLGCCNGATVRTLSEEKRGINIKAAFCDVLEIEVPNHVHKAKAGEEIEYYVSVKRGNGEIERWPSIGYFTITFPGEDFESMVWNAYA